VRKVSALGRFGFFIIIDTEKCMRLQFSHGWNGIMPPMRAHFNEKNRRILLCTSRVTAGLIIGRAFCATHLEFHFAEQRARVFMRSHYARWSRGALFKLHGNFVRCHRIIAYNFYILHANAVNLLNAQQLATGFGPATALWQ
jgi:hypothetical protein